MLVYLLAAGFIVIFLLSAYYAVAVIGPLTILQPRRFTLEDYRRCTDIITPEDLQLPFDTLTIQTRDGLKLEGWFVKGSLPLKGTVIYLHGVSDNKISGLPLAKLFSDHGYNVFLYDSRRHGESEGSFCTYGYYEKFDLSEAITQLEKLYGEKLGKVGVFGVSMGAAVALQAAGIDSRISAVAAEAPFADLHSISLDYQKHIIKVRWKIIRHLVMARAERIGKFKADEVSPLKALERISAPILFIHGKEDCLIDPQYSTLLYSRARPPKEIYFIEDASHLDTRMVGGKEYEGKLLNFFDRWLGSRAPTSN